MLQTEKQTPEIAAIAATLPKLPHGRLDVAATGQHLSPYHVREDRDGRDKTRLLRVAHAHICADSYCYMQLLVRVRTHAHALQPRNGKVAATAATGTTQPRGGDQ